MVERPFLLYRASMPAMLLIDDAETIAFSSPYLFRDLQWRIGVARDTERPYDVVLDVLLTGAPFAAGISLIAGP